MSEVWTHFNVTKIILEQQYLKYWEIACCWTLLQPAWNPCGQLAWGHYAIHFITIWAPHTRVDWVLIICDYNRQTWKSKKYKTITRKVIFFIIQKKILWECDIFLNRHYKLLPLVDDRILWDTHNILNILIRNKYFTLFKTGVECWSPFNLQCVGSDTSCDRWGPLHLCSRCRWSRTMGPKAHCANCRGIHRSVPPISCLLWGNMTQTHSQSIYCSDECARFSYCLNYQATRRSNDQPDLVATNRDSQNQAHC